MSVSYYDGNETSTASGRVLSKVEGSAVLLALDGPDGDGQMMTLTQDEAFKVALALLRDVSLARFGSG